MTEIHSLNCDVLVVGGGVTGVIAATAASRGGSKVVLLENKPFVGGNATSGLCLHSFISRNDEQVVFGIGQELIDELIDRGGAVGHLLYEGFTKWVTPVDGDMFRIVATEKLSEAEVIVIYGVNAVGVESNGNSISAVKVAMKNQIRTIKTKVVIDCSGDADIVASAGGEYRLGAPNTGKMQPVSMLLRCFGTENKKVVHSMEAEKVALATRADHPEPFPAYFRGSFSKWNEKVIAEGIVPNRDHMVFFNSVWPNQLNVNTTAVFGVDGTDPIALSRATVELTKQAARIGEFLKNNVDGFQNIHYVPAVFAGVRETRNIKGLYQITGNDVTSGRKFDDQIGECCFPADTHDPDTGQATFHEIGGNGTFGIPFRSLIPKNLENVVVAGRCMSSDTIAHAATRNMGPCLVTGEAAGVAASMAANSDVVDIPNLPVGEIQRELISRGAYVNKSNQVNGGQ
jgi:hypothetical protein